METDLFELMQESITSISFYLSDVTEEDFKKDIANLIKKVADKGAIELAIKQLQSLL